MTKVPKSQNCNYLKVKISLSFWDFFDQSHKIPPLSTKSLNCNGDINYSICINCSRYLTLLLNVCLKPIIEDEEEWKTRKIERVDMSFEFSKINKLGLC
jgi:hypothetical protein